MPASTNHGLEARKKDKGECDVYKKDPKKLKPEASEHCSSFIAQTTTLTRQTTITQLVTAVSTVPVTATSTATITGPAPTVTQTVLSDCGVVGFDNGATPAYFFSGSGAFGTFDTCSARCKQDAGKYMSFAFGSGQCLLYTANVATTVVPVATSPFTFFAVNCPAPAPAPTTPAPVVSPPVTPTTSAIAKRQGQQANVPDPLDEYQPAERSAFCSCAISVPSPATVMVSVTATSATTSVSATTATVTTAVRTSVVTPAPITVTVTTTA